MRGELSITKFGKKALLSGMAAAVCLSVTAPALADQFDTQIQSLSNSISDSQSQIKQLSQQEDTLSNKIQLLSDQVDAITAQLRMNNLKMARLNANIAQVQTQLDAQKEILQAAIQTVYLGHSTSIEMLVSSSNISEYLDRQQYAETIQDKINDAVKKIADLQATLKKQQDDLNAILQSQKAQQAALQSAKDEQASLLADTQNQEANYQATLTANKQKLQDVYAQRAALDASAGYGISTGGTGGYPYANYAPDGGSDPWGFYYRECVSYVAWKRRATGYSPYPMYWGNAGDWVNAAPTTSTPSVGAIAVFPPGVQGAGWVGHVAYVESVNSNGTFNLSEYNWRPYAYDYRTNVSPSGIRFIR